MHFEPISPKFGFVCYKELSLESFLNSSITEVGKVKSSLSPTP